MYQRKDLESKLALEHETQTEVVLTKLEALALLRLSARVSDRQKIEVFTPRDERVLLDDLVKRAKWAGDLYLVPEKDRDEGWKAAYGESGTFDFDGGKKRRQERARLT